METHRKPYIRTVRRNWWIARRKFACYMLREFTAVTNLWIVIEIIWFTALCTTDATHALTEIAQILANPCIIAANTVALIGVIGHIVTWYAIFPLGIRIFRSTAPNETRLIPRPVWTAMLYAITIVASIIILYMLTYGD